MQYGWMRMASGITDGTVYANGMHDSITTKWRDGLERIDYFRILDEMNIPIIEKAAFFAYVNNDTSIESIGAHFHISVLKLKDMLRAIYRDLTSERNGMM